MRSVVQAWIDSISPDTQGSRAADTPAFEELRAAIALAAPPDRRADLYDGQELPSHDILLKVVGLSEVATLAASGAAVPVDEIAADLEHLCAAPTPQAQDWILLDADLPAGTNVPIGPYTLRTLTVEQLRRAHPLPSLRPRTLNPEELGGSAFLVLPRPDRRLARGGLRLSFDIRPVLEHVKALAPLMLWRDEPLHAEAIFHVEPRRCVRTNMFVNTYNTTVVTDHEGNEVGEAHERGYFNVRDTEIAEFTAFCARVWDMADAVAPEDAQTTDVKGRKRRFRRAMDHLVLATAGTHGPGHVDPHEADELLLRCVIGLEAILTGGQQMNSRPMKNNGKALWLDATAQGTTEATFDKVYELRSKYAHGDDVVGLDETAVLEARTLLGTPSCAGS
ncbi:hypothetical protein ACIRL2_42495 [Embleya sp. NPDC127516]|uniref:hypothetical protein n=1 Tax=Embleya sp. NPDC127516 TaxID=3363990 RepID=UPI00381FA30D